MTTLLEPTISLTGLVVQDFRAYSWQAWQFSQPMVVVQAPNAAGKTTLIEAIHVLATGDSFRASTVEEMVKIGAELGRVKGKSSIGDEVEVMVTRGMVQGKRTTSRLFSVNGVKRRKADAIGKILAVVFRPEDLRLMEGSPSRRRQYLNIPLSVTHPNYAMALSSYEEVLKKRNKLLQAVREGEMPKTVLPFWTDQLVKHGTVIQDFRAQYLQKLADLSFPIPFQVEYLPSLLTFERLQQYDVAEVAAGHTLIGPHKDDFEVKLQLASDPNQKWWPVAAYGSRGQQRLAVLWLKNGEFQYLADHSELRPLWLLDDIFSELDDQSRQLVLEVSRASQTIITTTEPAVVAMLKDHDLQPEIWTETELKKAGL